MGSQLTREADATLYTRCGREIGVAATKTFTGQVIAFTLLALRLAELRGTLAADARSPSCAPRSPRCPISPRGYLADGVAALGRRPSAVARGRVPEGASSSTSGATSACRCASRARSS